MNPCETAKAEATDQQIAPDPSDDLIAENFEGWLAVWSLESVTPKETYEAGFRHGYEAGYKAAAERKES